MLATGGGDCPGLNGVIRGFVKAANQHGGWEVLGCYQSFNGILREPTELIPLTPEKVSGIHIRGGTIIGTTNKGGPFAWPVKKYDGTWETVDRSTEMVKKCELLGIDAVVNIGGDGSQRISMGLHEKGLPIVGVPKTIDNDLSATDMTFGFETAVEIATEAADKLMTTAESHNRVLILEVMGRDAGWIALNTAIAGGVHVCLIPEIPYDVNCVNMFIEERIKNGKSFDVIVISEGAKPIDGTVSKLNTSEIGYENIRLSGAADRLAAELKAAGCELDVRVAVLGHIQRGGVPIAFDRILAAQFGVKAFELVNNGDFGKMVSYRYPNIVSVPLAEAVSKMNFVQEDSALIHTARGLGICLGDSSVY